MRDFFYIADILKKRIMGEELKQLLGEADILKVQLSALRPLPESPVLTAEERLTLKQNEYGK